MKANQFRVSFLLTRQLNLRQPVLYIFLIPDAVDIAFPMQAGNLITVLHGIAVNVGIGFAKTVVGTLVLDTDGLGGRQLAEADPFVADADFRYRLGVSDAHIGFLVFAIQILTEAVIGSYTLQSRI